MQNAPDATPTPTERSSMRHGSGLDPRHLLVDQPPDRSQRRRRVLPERPTDQTMHIRLNRLHHNLRTHANAFASPHNWLGEATTEATTLSPNPTPGGCARQLQAGWIFGWIFSWVCSR